MLTLKQSPAAIFLMLLACSLAEGEPEPGKLIIALLIVFITFVYVLVCNVSVIVEYARFLARVLLIL